MSNLDQMVQNYFLIFGENAKKFGEKFKICGEIFHFPLKLLINLPTRQPQTIPNYSSFLTIFFGTLVQFLLCELTHCLFSYHLDQAESYY